jgi:putative sigma-54 modulation protein
MQISLNFKNIDSSDSLKSHVQEKFDRLDKMLDNSAVANVVLSVEKLCHIVEINLNCSKIKIYAKEESENNMYAAIDALSDKVKLQIKKNREKQRRHLAGDKQSIRTNDDELQPLEG